MTSTAQINDTIVRTDHILRKLSSKKIWPTKWDKRYYFFYQIFHGSDRLRSSTTVQFILFNAFKFKREQGNN